MKVSKHVAVFFVLGTLSLNSFAQSERIHCAPAVIDEAQHATVEEYQSTLFERGINLSTTISDPKLIDSFLSEHEKFPEQLRQELINSGNKINLIEGAGVVSDPSWVTDAKKLSAGDQTWLKTFDGRDWSTVPGAGGSTYSSNKVPTRVVVNHLYDHHGSSNLFLHEHAHSLDAIYKIDTISKSEEWTTLMSNNATTLPEYLRAVCGDYCVNNHQEAFAELFAQYHACEQTREQLERTVPEVAEYLKNLTTVEGFKPKSLPTIKFPTDIKAPKMPDLSDEVKAVKKGFSWLKSKVKSVIDDI
jgi:hypothetical protein